MLTLQCRSVTHKGGRQKKVGKLVSYLNAESGYWLMLMKRQVALFKIIKIINKRTKNSILGEWGNRQKYHIFLKTESFKVMIAKKLTFSHKNNVLIGS